MSIPVPMSVRVGRLCGILGAGLGFFVGVMNTAFAFSDLIGSGILLSGALTLLLSLLFAATIFLLGPGTQGARSIVLALAFLLTALLWLDALGIYVGDSLTPPPSGGPLVLFPILESLAVIAAVIAFTVPNSARTFFGARSRTSL